MVEGTGPQSCQPLDLPILAGGGENCGARPDRNRQPRHRHPATTADDEDRVPEPEAAERYQQMPGGGVGDDRRSNPGQVGVGWEG